MPSGAGARPKSSVSACQLNEPHVSLAAVLSKRCAIGFGGLAHVRTQLVSLSTERAPVAQWIEQLTSDYPGVSAVRPRVA